MLTYEYIMESEKMECALYLLSPQIHNTYVFQFKILCTKYYAVKKLLQKKLEIRNCVQVELSIKNIPGVFCGTDT